MENKFVNQTFALMAAQAIMLHYSIKGYHCSLSSYSNGSPSYVDLAIFHDSEEELIPHKHFAYSEREEHTSDGTFWTTFKFNY